MRSELEKLKEEFEVKTRQIVGTLSVLTEKLEFPLDICVPHYGGICGVTRKCIIRERDSEGNVKEYKYDVYERYSWRIKDGKLMVEIQSDYFHTTINDIISFDEFINYLTKERVFENVDPNYTGVVYEKLLPVSRATFYRIMERAGHELPIFLRKVIEKTKEKMVGVNETLERLNVILSQLESVSYTHLTLPTTERV